MQEKVNFRAFRKSDIPALVDVVTRNWKFDELLTKENAYHMAHVFLYYGLSKHLFTKVSEINGKVLGIIVANVGESSPRSKEYIFHIIPHIFRLILSKEGRNILHEYWKTVSINNRLFDSLEEEFDGELVLFAVDEEAQGLGVGSSLYQFFLHYLKKEKAQSYFLFTDTSCNYGYYDHKGLSRIKEVSKEMGPPINKERSFFIYKGLLE